jgi:hypothetical protein
MHTSSSRRSRLVDVNEFHRLPFSGSIIELAWYVPTES